MLVQTILNRIQKQPGFVYGRVRLIETPWQVTVEIQLRPRARRRPTCSGCQRPGPGYDTLTARRFEFVPLWGMAVFFVYAMRRVACPACGVRVETVPWALGKHHLTTTYAWFLATWAKRMSWTAVAGAFHTTWEHVFHSVEMAVTWGRAHMDREGITAAGIDEVQWQHGHGYLTLVYQLDEHRKRLLWIGAERKVQTLLGFFRWLGKERSARLRFICSDMWKPYLRVVAQKAGQACHIVDRFHVMAHFSKAIDQIRAQEARALKAKGAHPVLMRTRWVLLKRPANLTEPEVSRLAELLRYNLKAVRAYLLKEEFQFFWTYLASYAAGRFLDGWTTRALRSRLAPMQKVARMLRAHRPLLLNWFRAQGRISAGAVEGFNNKAKLTTRTAYGFRTYRGIELALYHALGDLPEPHVTHRFC
jgi:transposase